MTNSRSTLQEALGWFEILLIFILGFWLVAVRPLGLNLSQMPGTLQDTRFNNYVLEHDYRWMTGQDSSLWDAPIFYPYPLTLAFSDNHFGSMFFYAAFRVAGMDRETALQAWYLLSYFLSFAAAAFVLKKLDLKPLAVGMGLSSLHLACRNWDKSSTSNSSTAFAFLLRATLFGCSPKNSTSNISSSPCFGWYGSSI